MRLLTLFIILLSGCTQPDSSPTAPKETPELNPKKPHDNPSPTETPKAPPKPTPISLTKDWERPFIATISRLKLKQWENHAFSVKDFNNQGAILSKLLKTKKADWLPLLQDGLNGDQIAALGQSFTNKEYVTKLFATKEKTIIFQIKNHSNIIVKMDKRPATLMDGALRNYFEAFRRTQNIQKRAAAGAYDHLFLPLEKGLKEKDIGFVFSEYIPLFSEAEIDTIVLLHLMIKNAMNDVTLRTELKTVYSQVLTYICKVDFGDVSYQNMPFANDGRLSPFDADTEFADHGVPDFIKLFFAFKIFSQDELLAISAPCQKAYPNLDEKIRDIFNALTRHSANFEYGNKMVEEIISFLSTKTQGPDSVFSLGIPNDPDASIVEGIINQHIGSPTMKLFGRRCEVKNKFTEKAGMAFRQAAQTPLSRADAEEKVRDILENAKKNQKILDLSTISKPPEARDHRISHFICF